MEIMAGKIDYLLVIENDQKNCLLFFFFFFNNRRCRSKAYFLKVFDKMDFYWKIDRPFFFVYCLYDDSYDNCQVEIMAGKIDNLLVIENDLKNCLLLFF